MRKKGKRIRPGDTSLRLNFFAGLSISTFLLALFLLQIVNIVRTISRLMSGQNIRSLLSDFKVTPYFVFTILLSLVVATAVSLLYYRMRPDRVKQMEHREKLAEMVIENNWCEMESKKNTSFFKDLPSDKEKKKITSFPKIYYRFEDNQIKILVKISMGKNQEKLLNLESKLESGLFCECIMKELKESYIEYTLLYNLMENRIRIDEMIVKDNSLRLMKNLYWRINKLPHMLIIGGTGSGKSYFILSLITALLRSNAVLSIIDPKNADLADLATVMPDVYSDKDEIIKCLTQFEEDMINQSEAMKQHPNYKTGEDYSYLGLPPHFLIFDEFIAFMAMLDRKQSDAVGSAMMRIAMLGRQAGYFLILACQRPDSKYFGDGVRDQFNFRVALGRVSDLGYTMAFGETDKEFFLKDIKGRGYVDAGVGVISEFYTPLVPEGYDFLGEIGRLVREESVLN